MKKKYESEFFEPGCAGSAARRIDDCGDSREVQVHPNQVMPWKKHLMEGSGEIFATRAERRDSAKEHDEEGLLKKIGCLEIENDFLREASLAMKSMSGKNR